MNSNSNNCGKYIMLAMLAIFFISISAFAIVEIRNFYADESILQKILMNNFKTSKATPVSTQPEFVFIETNQNSERLPRALALEQNSTISTNNTTQKSNYYYEEQKPVVVYSKTDMTSPIAYKQLKEVPPKQDPDDDDEDPYRKPLPEDEDYDYFSQPSSNQQPSPSYYRQPPYQSASDSYYRSQPNANNYYRSPPPYPQYFDDSREDFPGPQQKEQIGSEEARNSQYSDYNNNNYYRQWHYATPPPPPPAPAVTTGGSTSPNGRLTPTRSGQENREVQQQPQLQQRQPPNRDPYAAYMDDYDDMPPHSLKPQPYPFAQYRKTPQQLHRYQQQQQIAQYRTPSSSSAIQAEEKQVETRPQMDVLTIIKSLKSMWDLYQSFSSSWNTIAERRNREEELEQQKLKQLQQIRINSKKPPPKFNNKRNQTSTKGNGNNKNSKKQTTTTTTTTTTLAPMLESLEMPASSEEELVAKVKKQPPAKVEPRKAAKGDKTSAKNAEGLRDKRQAAMETMSTDVGEGRYIKGDPLKGYYDFVITEGSYKFWAAFQVGTALLIIYSTFAAIYYSKVNPLVSDYDYTDYLGGARSLSGGDLDFVDDDDTTAMGAQKTQPKSWLDWLPRSGHSLKFILDAIDKLPVDHAEESIKDQELETSESNTDYVNSNVMAAERQEVTGDLDVENIDYAAEEGSGGDDVHQIVENRDNVKVIRDSNESIDEDVNVDHSKAM